MNTNKYDEVINGEETYKEIANKLNNKESVLIGWSDEEYSHYDILFTLNPFHKIGNYIQGGIHNWDLFISVMRIGAFAFKIGDTSSEGYYQEKLGIKEEKFAELINNVRKELLK